MEIADIYISHIIKTGSGFAARTDDGEQVFIPASVTNASRMKEGEMGTAKLIPNTHPNNASTPWVAVHIAKQADTPPKPLMPEKTLDDRVHETVCDMGYATTNEIAGEVGADIQLTHNALLRLFGKGRVAKADIYARPDQARASFCMWAKDVNHFLGGWGMTKRNLPKGRKPLTDADMADLTRRLADTAIEQSELYQAAKRDAEKAEAYAAELEDKLAKALESLTVIDALDPEGMVNGCSQSALIGLVSRMGDIARTTLAELKGEKNE